MVHIMNILCKKLLGIIEFIIAAFRLLHHLYLDCSHSIISLTASIDAFRISKLVNTAIRWSGAICNNT